MRWRSALTFAIIPTLLLIATWRFIREVGLAISIGVGEGIGPASEAMRRELPRMLDLGNWWRLARWESWSALRWWILFGVLTAIIACFSTRPKIVARHGLLFMPWLVVIELGYLAGVWIDSYNTVPEPSTIFAARWSWSRWTDSVWLVRGVAPSFLVGLVYFRSVARWNWKWSLAAATIFVPVAINASVFWSSLYY